MALSISFCIVIFMSNISNLNPYIPQNIMVFIKILVYFFPKDFNFQALCFTNFSKAPNWGQMLNYVFPITPFSTFLMSFCFFVTGQFQSYLATCPFGMSVIKNRVGYFAFTFGFVVYVVTHSDRLLTLHVAYQKNFWASLAATVAFLTDIATFLYRSQFIKSSTF